MDGNSDYQRGYRDTASRYSYLYINLYGDLAAAHGAANDHGNQYAYRAVIDPDADAASKRTPAPQRPADGRGGGRDGTGR